MPLRLNGTVIGAVIVAVLAAGGIGWLAAKRTAAETSGPIRTMNGKPDFSGIWQANNEAYWDLQAHSARAGMVTQQGVYPYEYAQVAAAPAAALGAAAGFPASMGALDGHRRIPYKPASPSL